MKKLLVAFLIFTLFILSVSAAGTFEYILPTEFSQIQYGTYLNSGRYIKALDKNGKEHLYNVDGSLIIGGYDSIMMYENGMGVGKNGDKYDIINYKGKVLSTHGEGFICLSGNFVYLRLTVSIRSRWMTTVTAYMPICVPTAISLWKPMKIPTWENLPTDRQRMSLFLKISRPESSRKWY